MSKKLCTSVLRYALSLVALSSLLFLSSGRVDAQSGNLTATKTEQALTSDFNRVARRWALLESLEAGKPQTDSIHQQVEDIDKAAQYDRYTTLAYLETLGPDQIGPLQAAVKRYFQAEVAYLHACEDDDQSRREPFKYSHIPEADHYRTEDKRRNGQALMDSLKGVVETQQEVLRVGAEAGLKLDPVWTPERLKLLFERYKAMIDTPKGY